MDLARVLTIAGSDCSGGAGIQADLKTIAAYGLYGMSAITALTAQNTLGVYAVQDANAEMVEAQLDAVYGDIRPDAVKIGMVSGEAIIKAIAAKLRQFRAKNVVVDPVMVSTSGCALLSPDAMGALKSHLLPLSSLLTPNMAEASLLWGRKVENKADMEAAARSLSGEYGVAVLVKGGHLLESAEDVLAEEGRIHWFAGDRLDNPNTHGTGCTLSSAIACGLAQGRDLVEAIDRAREYLRGALHQGLDLGKGAGPVDHGWRMRG